LLGEGETRDKPRITGGQMTNEDILRKAIEKAETNGYYSDKYSRMEFIDINILEAEHIIFSHDFAKAFWGEELVKMDGDNKDEFCSSYKYYARGEREWDKLSVGHFNIGYRLEECWQFHLQQMVLEEEPLKYLEKFL
jgi:hypothetical protein